MNQSATISNSSIKKAGRNTAVRQLSAMEMRWIALIIILPFAFIPLYILRGAARLISRHWQ